MGEGDCAEIAPVPPPPPTRTCSHFVEEERRVPLWMVGRLVGCWCVLLALSLMRGGHGAPPLFFPVPCGGVPMGHSVW